MPFEEKSQFLAVLAYGQISALEIASIKNAKILEFEINRISESAVIIESSLSVARLLGKRLGGTYKIAAVCGGSVNDLFDALDLPEEPKFNWTVSGYQCDTELLADVRPQVQSFLKSKSLGKSRFLGATMERKDLSSKNEDKVEFKELNIKELDEKILAPARGIPRGLDIVVHGGFGGAPLLGYTIAACDVSGFEQTDFSRSYQDPTTTLSPRLARIMVNLAMNSSTGTMMDPFCGLGTILQEALICGYNVVGIDISEANIHKTRTNLEWLFKKYHLSPKLRYKIIRGDSTRPFGGVESVNGIATEPILMPKFEKNPSSQEASRIINSIEQTYEKSLQALGSLDKNSKISITSPALIDDRGHSHTFRVQEAGERAGFKAYRPSLPQMRIEYPLRVPTTKKKIVQRDLYVMVKE